MNNVIEINFDIDTADKFPVYCLYGGQYTPQPAHIKVDIRNGYVWPDYNENIGGGCSQDEFHGLVQRFRIPADIHKTELNDLLRDNINFFQKVVDSYSEEWDGSNYVARPTNYVARPTNDHIAYDLEHEWESEIIPEMLIFGIIDVMQEFMDNKPSRDIEKYITDWFDHDGDVGWFEQSNAQELIDYIAYKIHVDDCEGNPELARWMLQKNGNLEDWEVADLKLIIYGKEAA